MKRVYHQDVLRLGNNGTLDVLLSVYVMFYQEYNFSIRTEWNGVPINHAPVTFQIRAQDSRAVLISVSGPFFNDPGPPPSCASGSPCDGLWDYEGKYFLLCDNGRIKLIGRT